MVNIKYFCICSIVVLEKLTIIFLYNLNKYTELLKIVKNTLNLLIIIFSLMASYFFLIDFKSSIYGQEFQVNPNDYFYSKQNPTNSQTSTTQNSEEGTKENCINNQIESVLYSGNDASSDSYFSDFHFVKKFDQDGNLIDSWGTVGSDDGQFLHAHGITIDSEDNVYVSDAENCNIQKFDASGKFITKWGTKGKGPGKFLQPESMDVDFMNNIYVAEYSHQNIQKFDSEGKFISQVSS